jgi:hypothetical protein
MPRGKIFRMRQLQQVISTCQGVRLEPDFGTPYTTGQSHEKICLFLDLASTLEKNVTFITNLYGIKRAERFAQWCMGRRINSYWQAHRPQLYDDIDRLKGDLNDYDRMI